MKRARIIRKVHRPARSRMKNRLSLAWLALACVGFLAAAGWISAAEEPSAEAAGVAAPAVCPGSRQGGSGKALRAPLNQVKFPFPSGLPSLPCCWSPWRDWFMPACWSSR